jgi:hypothetical protein
MYIVFIGNMFGANFFHGPFKTEVDAERWVLINADTQHYEIAKLQNV